MDDSMITNSVSISVVDTPEEAESYDNRVTLLKCHRATIVGNGTESKKPTVDLQLIDKDGNRFVVMATGAIMEGIGNAVKGKRERDESLSGE